MLEGNLQYEVDAAIDGVRLHEAGPAAGWPKHRLRFGQGTVDVGIQAANLNAGAGYNGIVASDGRLASIEQGAIPMLISSAPKL